MNFAFARPPVERALDNSLSIAGLRDVSAAGGEDNNARVCELTSDLTQGGR